MLEVHEPVRVWRLKFSRGYESSRKNLPRMYTPFSGALQRCLFSAGNHVSMGLSGLARIWSSAQ